MSLLNRPVAGHALALAILLSPATTFACATCGCTLSSDWENLGLSSGSGWLLDLRYDYLNQNQLRHGTSPISAPVASRLENQGMPQEIERFTRNQYLGVALDYSPNYDWGVNVQAPILARSHSTLGTASDGTTAQEGGGQYQSSSTAIGDVRIIGRYQGLSAAHNFGVTFGIKLPTGSHNETGISTDPDNPGPVPIDRGLQPGTGTTNAIVGAYFLTEFGEHIDFFSQTNFESALNSSDQYRPGQALSANLGIRYLGWEGVTPQLQINARHALRDRGLDADIYSTGGTVVYVSPGATVPLSKRVSFYAFVQLPVFQDVRGVQLAPRYTASAGARISF